MAGLQQSALSSDAKAHIASAFDSVASTYERFDALEQEVGRRLLERVGFARRSVRNIVDLGCGTGRCARSLKKHYAESVVTGLDISGGMLQALWNQNDSSHLVGAIQGDFERIPIDSCRADLVVSNLSLQWASDLIATFREIRRVISREGMVLFSIPGDASFPELREPANTATLDSFPVQFSNLTEIGDLLLAEGFVEPVMDSEIITLQYPDYVSLEREFAGAGTAGFNVPALDDKEGVTAISVEILYGTAFGPVDR